MLADEIDPLEIAAEDAASPAPDPATEPKVVLVYRDRGIPWLLVPPLLLIAAVGGIVVYRTSTPKRPRPTPEVSVASTVVPGPTETNPPADPVPPPVAVPVAPPVPPAEVQATEPAPARRPNPEPEPPKGLTTSTPPAVAHAPGGGVLAPEPASSVPTPAIAATAPSPFDPAPVPPVEAERRDAIGFDPDATRDRDKAVPSPGPTSGTVAGPSPPGTNPAATMGASEVDADIRRESERIRASRLELEAAKPELLNPDPRDARLRVEDLMSDARRRAAQDRRPFHRDLRRLLDEMGNRAGPEIRLLLDRYDKEGIPEINKLLNRDLVGPATRLTTKEKVIRMRRWGAPEAQILEDIFFQEHRNRSGRGGPRSEDEAWVYAANVLLGIPPGTAAGAADRPAPSRTAATPAGGR